jgi:hypothetical protein
MRSCENILTNKRKNTQKYMKKKHIKRDEKTQYHDQLA